MCDGYFLRCKKRQRERPLRQFASLTATLPLLSLRDIFPRPGGSLSSKGEARALSEIFSVHLKL